MSVQSVLFDRKKYNCYEARKWLKKHKFKPIKRVDKTKNLLRYRLINPRDKIKYRIKKITKFVKFVIAFD